MTVVPGEDDHGLLAHVLLPVANGAEARAPATAGASRPGGRGRLVQLRSGDRSRPSVVSAGRPATARPRAEPGQ